jgi:hypothetical protein
LPSFEQQQTTSRKTNVSFYDPSNDARDGATNISPTLAETTIDGDSSNDSVQAGDDTTNMSPTIAEKTVIGLPAQKCEGIRSSILSDDHGFMLWIAKQLDCISRSVKAAGTSSLNICDLIAATDYNESMKTGNHLVELLNNSVLKTQSLQLECEQKEEQYHMLHLSTKCYGLASSAKSKACKHCKKAKGPVQCLMSRLTNYTPVKFNWKTNNSNHSSTPRRAIDCIVYLKTMVQTREKSVCRLIAQRRDEKLSVNADNKISSALRLAVATAAPAVRSQYGDDSAENTLFDALRNHVIKYGQGGPNKSSGIRCDPC